MAQQAKSQTMISDGARPKGSNRFSVSGTPEQSTMAAEAPDVQLVQDPASAALQALLKLEAEIRSASSSEELSHVVVNETRKLMRARQVFAYRVRPHLAPNTKKRSRIRLEPVAVSSLSSVDRNAPLMQALENLIGSLKRSHGIAELQVFRLDNVVREETAAETLKTYPMREMLWVPLATRQEFTFAGLLFAREVPWTDADLLIARRISNTAAHAYVALQPKLARKPRAGRLRTALCCLGIAAALAMAIPVPMMALAPFEIVPRSPIVVTAPIDGVIDEIPIKPNSPVKRRDLLVKLNDVTLRNALEVANRELRVAEARLKRANQAAFESIDGRRELAVATAERDVRIAERNRARELLERSRIFADSAAIAVFGDRSGLIGRPVKVGERLMELADPAKVEARIDVPVADGGVLAAGRAVKLFLDSEPLRPRSATITAADFEAKPHQGERVSFRAIANLESDSNAEKPPRLGVRGTAQIYGDPVPLGLYLFRRPITAVRQWLGL